MKLTDLPELVPNEVLEKVREEWKRFESLYLLGKDMHKARTAYSRQRLKKRFLSILGLTRCIGRKTSIVWSERLDLAFSG